MIRRRHIKAIYIDELLCDECGKQMAQSPVVLTVYPPQYSYYCENCGTVVCSSEQYGELKYEFGEEECIES